MFFFSILFQCNSLYIPKTNHFGNFETSQVALVKIGEFLRNRQKRDFYEWVQYHESSNIDPSRKDESLKKKNGSKSQILQQKNG